MTRIGWRALARYLAGESTAPERAAIEEWVAADAGHARILESAQHAWSESGAGAHTEETARAWRRVSARLHAVEPLPSREVAKPRWHKTAGWGAGLLAAGLAFAILIPAVRNHFAPHTIRFATGASEITTVHLTDGSVVRLAPNTELRVTPKGSREAWLDGKAYFAIAKQHGAQFVVHTKGGDAHVLGTRFELQSGERDVRLVVFEGRVALTTGDARAVVEAGQVSSAAPGRAPTLPRAADVRKLSPWMNDVLIFEATPLSVAAREIERQYKVHVRFTDSDVASRTISAVFEHQSLQTVITAVCRVADATCEVHDREVSVSPR